jgi:hypothetical protein
MATFSDESLADYRSKALAAAIKRLKSMKLNEAFDPFDMDSRPTEKQKQILVDQGKYLHQYVSGGNQSGKSALGGRTVAWFFKRNHPHIDMEKIWGGDPVLIIVCGRVSRQVDELWEKKIKPFLSPGEYKEQRVASSLSTVTSTTNGSKIIFATHHNTNEAREKIQSYTAHLVWLDELTDSLGIVEELQRRVQAKRGRFLMTFTPKLKAPQVKRFIEQENDYSKLYRISMLDNPIYEGRHSELMAQINGLPEGQRNTILYGDWYVGENAVFAFDPSKHISDILYNQGWPHICVVDPAASGLVGYTLWAGAYDNAQMWYLVDCAYFKGEAPSDMVDKIEKRIEKFSVIKRVSDPHETWFIKEASRRRSVVYEGVPNKVSRKKELIAQVNEALGSRIMLLPHCEEAIEELSSCQWSETNPDRIVAAHSYHLADCIQYFVDRMPKYKKVENVHMSFDAQLKAANQLRIKREEERRQKGKQKWTLRKPRKSRRWQKSQAYG